MKMANIALFQRNEDFLNELRNYFDDAAVLTSAQPQ